MRNLEACQFDLVDTKNLNDSFTETDDRLKASSQMDSARQRYWFGLAIVALIFVAETALTWRKWSALPADMGADLYMPWRICAGSVLYRDLFFFAGGPFSQYFDALLFKIFGASFLTLAIFNLATVALMVLALFHRFSAVADTWTATMICLATIIVFAFGYYFFEEFNYAVPYTNEALHGLILSVITIGFLSDWISRGNFRWAILAGFCTGLVFLTKPDIFLALAVTDIVAFGLLCSLFRNAWFAVKSCGAFLAAAAVPPLFFFFYFLRVENWHDSLRSVVFAWVPVLNRAVLKNAYYQWCAGLDRPSFHMMNMLFQSALVVAVTVFYAAAFGLIKAQTRNWTSIQQRAVPVFAPLLLILIVEHWRPDGEALSSSFVFMLACLCLLLAIGIFLLGRLALRWRPDIYRSPWAIVLILMAPLLTAAYAADWIDCGYSLPLISLVCCALIYWNRHTLAGQQKFVFPWLWTVFGLMTLSKLGFFPRIWHYGFVLAMPAFVTAIYCLLWLIPVMIEKKWRVRAFYFRVAVCAVLMLGFVSLFRQSEANYAKQNISVGAGNNQMLASEFFLDHANEFNAALDWIQCNVPKDATLAAIPEGASINFLAGRINPTPCVFWDHNVMAVFGEATMNAAFERSPPDYVLIIDRNFGTLDPTPFGSPGYDQEVMRWIEQNYQTQILIGHEPLKNKGFGIKILKLNKPLASGTGHSKL